MTDAAQTEAKKLRRRFGPRGPLGWTAAIVLGLAVLLAAAGVGVRHYVTTASGRAFIVSRVNGLKLGSIGNLHVEGLTGDVLSDFSVARLTITDQQGVWLEGRQAHVVWDYRQLVHRFFSARLISVDDLKVYRRPLLTPIQPGRHLPVSIDIGQLSTKLESLPQASIERGLFAVTGHVQFLRMGGGSGHIDARSLLHAGDGVTTDFSYGQRKPMLIVADAVEANGGAMAGALGLPSKKPFSLKVRIGGLTGAGQIDVLARSGDTTPLEATGGWDKSGLHGQGRLDLTASTWTQPQIKRFGPQLSFTASGAASTGKSAQAGLYAVHLQAHGENLDLTASGPVKIADRSTSGLAVDIKVGDMSRIETAVPLGSSQFHGKLTGKLDDFRLAGNVEGERLSLWGYTLGQAQGTGELRLAKRELTIKGDMTGAGGGGSGWLAGLLGATPHATTEITRLADGRLFIRSIDGQGSGIELHAEGSRTPIIGTLNFSGHARITNLAAIRKGASGVAEGEWSASQGLNNIWAFTADAHGTQFATGMEQVDRLVGATPKLEGRAELDHGAWRITRSTLNGKAGNARATGVYGPDNALDLAVNWDAAGPFDLGPVEIGGKIAGAGTVKGTLTEPRVELVAQIPGIDVGALALNNARLNLTVAHTADAYSGTIAVAASSANGPATARATFNLPADGVELTGIDASAGGVTTRGSLFLRSGEPSRADLTLNAGPGSFLAAGQAQATVQIVDAAGGARATVNLKATDVQLPDNDFVIHSAQLSASGPYARLPYTLKADIHRGDIPVTLDGSGVASHADQVWTVSFAGQGRVNKIAVNTIEPLTINVGGPALTAAGTLSVGGGRAVIQARQEGENISADARLTGVDVSVISQDLAGRFDAQLTATGRGKTLSGQLDANLQNMRSRDGPTNSAINGVLKAQLAGDSLRVDVQAANQAGLRSTASAVLPAEATASPFWIAINRTKPIAGSFDIDGELQPIWDLFFGGARTLGGRLVAKGTLSGTLKDPQVSGQANLTDGKLEDFATGLKLRNVTMAADLQRNAITVSNFAGQDQRNGTLSGRGRVSLEAGGDSSFTLHAQQFLLLDNDIAHAQASGDVTVTRAADGKAALTGALTIDRADVAADPPTPSGVVPMDVIEINVPPERSDIFDAPRSRGPSVSLDVTLKGPRRIFVKGRGLTVEMSLDAHVGGTSTQPRLTGEARVVQGEYEFAGKRFAFDDTGVVYLGTSADAIRLDLSATRDDPTLTAVVKIKGTAAKPEITLSSTPSLPNDEVLAQVLFGRSAAQLSPVEAAQLASSLAALATGGGFDVIGGLREFVKLDRLAFGGGDAQSGLTVSGGKYVSDNVYLELTGGGRDGGAAQVEWRVRRNLSVVSRVSGAGDTRLSIRWKQDYGKKPKTAPASTPAAK